MNTCGRCGLQNRADLRFCADCGARLGRRHDGHPPRGFHCPRPRALPCGPGAPYARAAEFETAAPTDPKERAAAGAGSSTLQTAVLHRMRQRAACVERPSSAKHRSCGHLQRCTARTRRACCIANSAAHAWRPTDRPPRRHPRPRHRPLFRRHPRAIRPRSRRRVWSSSRETAPRGPSIP